MQAGAARPRRLRLTSATRSADGSSCRRGTSVVKRRTRDGGRGKAGVGRHMTIYSEEAKATAAKVERILKIARAAFFDAIDFLACIEALEAGKRLGRAGSGVGIDI